MRGRPAHVTLRRMADGSEDEVHRPLPSVGMPLLRDDVRASRIRRAVLAAGAIVIAIVGLAIFALPRLLSSAPEGTSPAAAAAPSEPPLSELGVDAGALEDEVEDAPLEVALDGGEGTRITRAFGEAPGFRAALINAGCTGAEADALISALDDAMDFRRCRPNHQLIIDRDVDGHLSRFEYRASNTQIYQAERGPDGALVGSQLDVPIERIRLARGGVIQSSLGAALEAAGLGRQLVGTFVETFEREVNFNTDTRTGDTFRIIVEEERVAGEFLRYGTVHAVEVRGQRLGERQAFWYVVREGSGDFYDPSGRAVHGGWLRTPLRYDHISSPFDPRRMHPILRRIHPHNGVDYAAGTGTPVWAAADGRVTFVGPRGANGNLVSIEHANGYETHYAHLHRFAPGLERGDEVRQRQAIGQVGTTGRSTGPHLHFGLKRNGRFIDPQAELNGPGRMMPGAHLGRYRRLTRELRRELAEISVTAPVQPEPEHEGREEEPTAEATD